MEKSQKVNILLVDDHAENLVALEAILGDLGENLVKAQSGKEALKYLLDHEVALILLDVAMPVMDGFETAALIREREKLQHTPIIFVTAISTSEPQVSKGYSLGAVDYISKPFPPELLRWKVLVFVDLFKKTQEVKHQAELLRQTNRELYDANKKLIDLNQEIEKKNAELQVERDFISTVLHTANSLVLILDREGHIVRFNRACEQLTGYSFHEVRGRCFWDLLLVPKESEACQGDFQNILLGALPIQSENNWLTKQGSRRLVAWTKNVIPGNQAVAEFVVCTGMDITDRHRAEQERVQRIREQAAREEAEGAQKRASFLAEASAVLASSIDYKTTVANVARLAVPALADWCLLYTAEVDGSVSLVQIANPDEITRDGLPEEPALWTRKPTHDLILKAIRAGKPELIADISDSMVDCFGQNEYQHARLRQAEYKSAIVVPLQNRGVTLGAIAYVSVDSGRRYGLTDLALAQDFAYRFALAVDKARLYNDALEANRAKDEFLATVSHELRTPLSVILGWIRLLRSGNLDETNFARALETIERNAKSQAQLVEDILDASRIIKGMLRLSVQPVDLVSVIESALDSVRPMAEAKGVRVDYEVDAQANSIQGDPSRLQQVVWNLLSNAVKFTPQAGHVKVTLAFTDSHARITVEDTGQGIKPDFLPYVFDRFRQGESGLTRANGGLGLGLAVVRQLVELHGGTVEAKSPGEGQGATFTVTLPVRSSQSNLGADETMPSTSQVVQSFDRAPLLDGLRVLLVEDEPDTIELLAAVLRRKGAMVFSVGSAAEALEALGRERPDVLVSDIAMPLQDGYKLISKIRALKPDEGGIVPALAVTACARPEDRTLALSAGYNMYLPKPVEPTELVNLVAQLAGRTTPSQVP